MLRPSHALALTLLLYATTAVHAGIVPSFTLESSAWNATDIIIATPGATPDQPLTILEVWHGTLKPQTRIHIADLTSPPVQPTPIYTNLPDNVAAAQRLVLFLKPAPVAASSPATQPAIPILAGTNLGGPQVSMVWIEQDHAKAYMQEMNPGPAKLTDLDLSEAQLKTQTLAILAARDEFHRAQALPNKADRAKTLQPLGRTTNWLQRDDVFAALGQCGPDALPYLRAMLHDDGYRQQIVVGTLAAVAPQPGAEMIPLLREELAFWRKTAPMLPLGWWNDYTAVKDLDTLRNRYGIADTALRVLAAHPGPQARESIQALRDFWSNAKCMADFKQITEECDQALKALPAK